MNRQDAKLHGARFYQGFSCRFGHEGLRYTSTGNCVRCMNGGRPSNATLITKSYTGLPEDLAALDQLWRSLLEARAQRVRLAGHTPTPQPAPLAAESIDPSMLPPKLP